MSAPLSSKRANGDKKGEEEKKKPISKKKLLLLEQNRLLEEAKKAEDAEIARRNTEEKKKTELEEKLAAETRAAQAEEDERLLSESSYEAPFVYERHSDLQQLEQQIYEKTEWEKFLECNPLPDVEKESSINTYLSLWRADDEINPPHLSYKPTLDSCSTTERVIDLLESVASRAREELRLDKMEWCHYYTNTLRDITTAKMDFLTAQFLSRADEYEDHDTKVMNRSHNTPDIAFGLWVHSSAKHGRIKRIDFPKIGFTIELPVALQKSRTSIRVIRTLFDHTSNKIETHTGPLATEEKTNTSSTSFPASTPTYKSTSTKPLMLNFVSVGGIVNIEQLALPPPPKKAKGWVLREITPLSRTISIVPYPASSSDDPNASTAAGVPLSQNPNIPTGTSQAPLRVTFTLPEHVFLDDREPHFGWWDARNSCWRQEGVSLTKYDPKLGQVNLSLTLLKPFAIIQPRSLDFPYRAWSLTSATSSSTNAVLSLTGSRTTITIGIQQGGKCQLISPLSPVLNELNSIPNLPGVLFSRMERAGINVQPTMDDAAYCRKPIKDIQLTAALHEHLALICNVFDIAGCTFNSSQSSSTCIFKIRLNETSQQLITAKERKAQMDAEKAAKVAPAKSRRASGVLSGGNNSNTNSSGNLHSSGSSGDILKSGTSSGDMQERTLNDDDNGLGDDLVGEEDEDDEITKLRKEVKQAELSAEDKAAKEAASAAAAALEAEKAREAAAAAAISLAERLERGKQWHTIMVSLTKLDHHSAASQPHADTHPIDEITGQYEMPTVDKRTGNIPENIPGGDQLLKFIFIKGGQHPDTGLLDTTPLPNCVSHVSLRRAVYAYYYDLTLHDLATALYMQVDNKTSTNTNNPTTPATTNTNTTNPTTSSTTPASTTTPAPASSSTSAPQPTFLPCDHTTLQAQQTIRRTLNLCNVFTFH